MESIQINLLPFVVEALGNNKKIYKDIDKLYQESKYDFYKVAKESELYNHQIIKMGSLIQEEYSKKILGILLGAGEDEYIHSGIRNLIKKGFRYSWTYTQNHAQIDLDKFVKAFAKKFKGMHDENKIQIDFYAIIVLYLAFISSSEIVRNDFYNDFLNDLAFRWQFYNDANKIKISLDKASDIDKEKIKQVKNTIYKKHGQIRNFNDLLIGQYEAKNMDITSFLFDYENLSTVSIFEDIKFGTRDIDEILYLYVISSEKLREYQELDIYGIVSLIDDEMIDNATSFLISHIYTKYLIKAYKQVKKMYFENNKETMFVELEGLEKSLISTSEKLLLIKQNISELQEANSLLEKENARLKAELEHEKRNREELNSLREFLFSLDKQEDFISENFNPDVLKDYRAMVIGGHEKWQQRMKELLPNFIFIHPDNMNFDARLLDGINYVFVYVNYLNHGLYYKVMNSIEGKNVKVAYINQQNENTVMKIISNNINMLR